MYPKVREVLPIVKGHEEIHDDMCIPRGALIGRDEVSKREIGSEGSELGRRGREEGALAPPFSTMRPSALLDKVQLALRMRPM